MPIRPQDSDAAHEPTPYRVRLPGFTADNSIGLGEVIKRATSYLGIQPCGGCERRAEALNRLLTFTTNSAKENR